MGSIDIHTHLACRSDVRDQRNVPYLEMGGFPLGSEIPVDRLLAEMDRGGIEMSVIMGSPANADISTDYEAQARAIEPYRDRLIPFVCLDPWSDDDPYATVRHSIEELGYRGVGEWGYNDFTDPVCDPVYQACIDLDVPILIHTGATLPTTPLKWGRPLLVDDVAIRFPELKIIAAHCGAPWIKEMATVAERQPNVWVDLAALQAFPKVFRVQALVTMVAAGLWDRLLFGSDFPVTSPADWARWVRGFRIPKIAAKLLDMPAFGRRERDALMEGNARRLLNL